MEYNYDVKSINLKNISNPEGSKIYPVLPTAPSDEGHNYRLQKIGEIQKEIENEKKKKNTPQQKVPSRFQNHFFCRHYVASQWSSAWSCWNRIFEHHRCHPCCDCVRGCCYWCRVFIHCRRTSQQKTSIKSGEA